MRPSEEFGARIFFSTTCTCQLSGQLKRHHIHKEIQIADADILTFVTSQTKEGILVKKNLPTKLLFYADDGIHNLLDADTEWLLSMKKPWNYYNESERKRLEGKNMVWFEDGDLKGMNEFVYDLILDRVKQILS